MRKEAITHGVLDDLANRNENWEKLDGVPEKVDLLTDELGLIKDYVIESDSNPDGSWEKWSSGKMTLTRRRAVSVPVNVEEITGFRTNSTIQIDYGQTFVGTPIIKSITVNALCWASLDSHDSTMVRFWGLTFRSTRIITSVAIEVEGRWK